jgi:hypothetical protein
MHMGERIILSSYKNLSGPGVCRLYLQTHQVFIEIIIQIPQLPIMLFSLCTLSVFAVSALACAEHGNHHYPGSQIKKRAEAGAKRNWEYATSYDWGSIQSGKRNDYHRLSTAQQLTLLRL